MENKIRYTLGKEERLKSRKAIEQLFKEGKSFSFFPFRILYLLKQGQESIKDKSLSSANCGLQAGFSISSRRFKRAVDRNRVKRLMREAYRLQKNELRQLPELTRNSLAIFFIYVGKEVPEYKLLHEKMTAVLKRLIKLTSEPR